AVVDVIQLVRGKLTERRWTKPGERLDRVAELAHREASDRGGGPRNGEGETRGGGCFAVLRRVAPSPRRGQVVVADDATASDEQQAREPEFQTHGRLLRWSDRWSARFASAQSKAKAKRLPATSRAPPARTTSLGERQRHSAGDRVR